MNEFIKIVWSVILVLIFGFVLFGFLFVLSDSVEEFRTNTVICLEHGFSDYKRVWDSPSLETKHFCIGISDGETKVSTLSEVVDDE